MIEWQLIIRLILAALLGGIVGLERQRIHKPAGLRTHMLVCLGSALFTMISFLVLADYAQFAVDPTRVAAGIVTGIGFLGAGVIFHSKETVIGLTTATSIWVVAAIGMAVGFGYYLLAGVTAILSLVILFVLEKFERRI